MSKYLNLDNFYTYLIFHFIKFGVLIFLFTLGFDLGYGLLHNNLGFTIKFNKLELIPLSKIEGVK